MLPSAALPISCHAEAYCAWVGKELCGGFDDAEPLNEKQMLDPQ